MGEEPNSTVTTPTGAVFLSYASQDAQAVQRICQALRAAGIEVWFDQSELRGGDAWDRKIREQIHDCRLFIPVISANSERRDEGYFRREWSMAADRTRDMAHKRSFLLPVVIDATPERGASVPDKFHELQWTRLPGGETPPAFVDQIKRLLSPEAPTPIREPASSQSGPVGIMSAPTQASSSLKRGALIAAGVAVLAATAYLAIEKPWVSKPALSSPIVAPSAAPAAFNPPRHSVAVLPFVNMSGDKDQEYFSDGISEDLITALSQFPGLKVIGRTSAFQFRDSKDDSRSIGAKLGVAHLLEGSVRKSGDMIRVSAELIDTADASTQWSERYDRPYKDLFVLQDDITRAVAGALKAKLLPGENAAAQSERPQGGSLEAYNALMMGRFYFLRETAADYRKAIDAYTQAVGIDPRYALAWSELSRTWAWLGVFLAGAPAQEAYAKAREAADRALSLSPDLASAHISRGFLLQAADFNWRGAEADFRRALELASNDGLAKAYLANLLATLGDLDSAIDLTRQALPTDPLRPAFYIFLASFLSGANRLDEAERASRMAIELRPEGIGFYGQLSYIEALRGNAQAALDAARREPDRTSRNAALALAWQIAGDRKEADAALRALIDEDANSGAYLIADVYAQRNDVNGTFDWLDRAWTNRDTGIGNLYSDPIILRYKGEPRFAAFCRKVGLPTPAEIEARK